MTTEVQARDAIVAYLNPLLVSQYPSLLILYENTARVDLDTVGSCFIRIRIDFTDSLRMGLDASPGTDSHGEVILTVFAKDGVGSRDALSKINFLRETLKYKVLSGVTLDVPRPGKKQPRDGWTSNDLIVPFRFWQ